MRTPPIHSICEFKQGKHCTKIGSKCVEERWFNSAPCLIAEKKEYQYGREIITVTEGDMRDKSKGASGLSPIKPPPKRL